MPWPRHRPAMILMRGRIDNRACSRCAAVPAVLLPGGMPRRAACCRTRCPHPLRPSGTRSRAARHALRQRQLHVLPAPTSRGVVGPTPRAMKTGCGLPRPNGPQWRMRRHSSASPPQGDLHVDADFGYQVLRSAHARACALNASRNASMRSMRSPVPPPAGDRRSVRAGARRRARRHRTGGTPGWNGAAASAPRSGSSADEEHRPVHALHHARRDDADDARVPVRRRQHDAVVALPDRSSLRACAALHPGCDGPRPAASGSPSPSRRPAPPPPFVIREQQV
jgi:hypothetical protein